jgi:pyruvate formate lyase activating enzyme
LHICPKNLVSVAGVEWEAKDLADKLLTHKTFFNTMGGGITLSGGEPLLQVDFCVELLTLLKGQVHIAIETSGYAKSDDFKKVISLCDFVYMDIKLADSEQHKKYTGVDNKIILENAKYLKQSGIPHTFRTPLIPNITDTEENLSVIEQIVKGSTWEKLDYNPLAGAKYASVGRKFKL